MPSGRWVAFSLIATPNESVQNTDTAAVKLSGKRRIVVQDFKGKWFVNLREYYEDNSGEMKPTKKVSELNANILVTSLVR